MADERRVHPDCINASNPYHECVEYCFLKIAEAKARAEIKETEVVQAQSGSGRFSSQAPEQGEEFDVERPDHEQHSEDDDNADNHAVEDNMVGDVTQLTGRKKKLFELRLRMNEARKANQQKIGKLLDANDLDMTKAYMLDTQDAAEAKYKKWEKDPAPYGWDVFNQKTLYNAHKKRTRNIDVDLEEYNKMKEADPEFYRQASSLQYGKAPKASEDKVERMVKELTDRDEKRKSFSRRRRFRDEKDIDSINDRNEHFNKKIERAFGKYTLEIKNNLERGTALPD
ncbi:unnamed protein product [Dovyalis caffra]|uniref:Pre-mRNA-splicing factor SYF2 n=1 Tax=Dovyalis caffra TaxID=77055 RepID=A0AAV1R654_9ROSI|nr:unnamed protein product [Dovyalis caffra]